MMVETYLRQGRRTVQRLLLEPGIRGILMALFYGGSGFLLSAVSLGSAPQPMAMGMICGATGWGPPSPPATATPAGTTPTSVSCCVRRARWR